MKLTPENYYSLEANLAYMSVSQFKEFQKCESLAMAKLNGYKEPKQDYFLLGSYVHAAIEGPEAIEQFKQENPEIFCSTGKNKGELKSEYQKANKMIDAVLSDELCKRMLEGEKEVIITAELFGVKWKSKIDVHAPEEGRISDLKTTEGIRKKYWIEEESRYGSFVEAYKYPLQMAVYAEVERLHSKRFELLEPFLVAVSKEEEPDKEIICFDEQTLVNELEKVRKALPRIMAVKEGIAEPRRCGRCAYCRITKKAEIVHYLNLLEA